MLQRASLCAFVLGLTLSAPVLANTLVTGAPADTFQLAPAASGLTGPTSVDWLPDGRMVVTEKTGNVVLIAAGDGGTNKVIGTFSVDSSTEKGLLHVLVHPDFATNKRLIFYYSASDAIGGTNVDRHRVVTVPLGDNDLLDMTKESILLRGLRGPANHDGGSLAIGPDGKLYVGVGDTGCNSGDPPEPIVRGPTNYFGTCLSNANGKILRINLDGTIPTDNPLVGKQVSQCGAACSIAPLPTLGAPRTEIWAWGFRNPWRFSFDMKTGNLWVGDVGEVTYEEIDVIPQTGGGKHYGWPWREGGKGWPATQCKTITPDVGDCVDPQYYCSHPGTTPYTDAGDLDGDCSSITGGVIVDSCAFPESYRGKYFFADAARSWVATLTPTADRNGIEPGGRDKLINVSGQPVDIAVGPDGALYYAVYAGEGTGSIQRLYPKVPSTCPTLPEAGTGPDAGLPDASEPGTGGNPSAGGSGNSGGRVSSGGVTSGTGGSTSSRPDAGKDGGPGASAAGDDSGCDCRIGGDPRPGTAALVALGVAATFAARRRRRKSS